MLACGVRVGLEKVCVLGETGARERESVGREFWVRLGEERERVCVCVGWN